MALDKLVDSTALDAALSSVADAIRAKGGTSTQLAFPAGFVSAIGAIPTGGGGGTKTYIVKDGKIQNGYTFSSMATTTVTEENDGYLKIYTAGNNYGAAWVIISDLTGYNFLVCEFLDVSGSYGIIYGGGGIGIGKGTPASSQNLPSNSRLSVTANDANGQIVVSKPQLTVPAITGAGYIKLSCTGSGSFNGRMNIKDIYFVTE